MRRFIGAIAIALGFSGMAVVVTAAPAQASTTCTSYYSYDEHWFYDIMDNGKDIKAYTTITYFNCKNDQTKNRWVEPAIRQVGYETFDDGVRVGLDCSVSGTIQNLKFDLYFWDRAGHAIDPGVMTAPCESNGSGVVLVAMDRNNNPRLLNCGGAPRWSADVQVSKRWGGDAHSSLAGTMWGYGGVFPVHPNCP